MATLPAKPQPVPGAGGEGWREYHKRVRPLSPDIRGRVAEQIAGHDARVLLLGVTRDYAVLGEDLTAVDFCPEQIANVWIGDGPGRRAILADWREMDFPPGSFTAAVGDGSLSTLTWPADYRRVLEKVASALVPGGLLVVRCFMAPDEPETVEQVIDAILAGRAASFYGARWRLGMALTGSGNVAVAEIHQSFERAFPDRDALARATGWSRATIDLIDAYRGSALIYSFLTRRELLETVADTFANARFVSSGEYPRAEGYPLLVAERRT
jgi:SAM-dependent methyltransferase